MTFKLWSESNIDARQGLMPDLQLRKWGGLSEIEKVRFWKFSEDVFFPLRLLNNYGEHNNDIELNVHRNRDFIEHSIAWLDQRHKLKIYAKAYSQNQNYYSAFFDFYEIFSIENENVVLELLSLFAYAVLTNCQQRKLSELNEDDYLYYDECSSKLNTLFLEFKLDYHLTRLGFMPRQEIKIIQEVYEPVINHLTNPKFEPVSRILRDAFLEYGSNTPSGYSSCITHCVAAVEGFLQIIVFGGIGKGKLTDLFNEGQKRELIPNDLFTKKIINSIISVMQIERMETGDAHPKEDYATEKNAKLILNLSMVFIQHCS
jgi:hypothetical protein